MDGLYKMVLADRKGALLIERVQAGSVKAAKKIIQKVHPAREIVKVTTVRPSKSEAEAAVKKDEAEKVLEAEKIAAAAAEKKAKAEAKAKKKADAKAKKAAEKEKKGSREVESGKED